MCSIMLIIGTSTRQLWMSRTYNYSMITGMFTLLILLVVRLMNEEKLPLMLKIFSFRAVTTVPFITIDHFAINKPFVLIGDAGIYIVALMTFFRESSGWELEFRASHDAVGLSIYIVAAIFAATFKAGYRQYQFRILKMFKLMSEYFVV